MCHYIQKYCKDYEKIENYQKALADNFKNWDCHHRLETHTSDGVRRLVDITQAELKALDMYYNRPASELIFLPTSEHQFLHHKGKQFSEEHKKKLSEAKKGEDNPMYGKHHTDETRKKLREANKGKQLSEETKNKMREAKKGKHHSEETKKKIGEANKGKPKSDETKNKMREAAKGKNTWIKGTRWYNDGKVSIRAKECPEGFTPGRLFY